MRMLQVVDYPPIGNVFRIMFTICLLLLGASAHGGVSESKDREAFSYGISMSHLIAHPERFNGRTVILQGYLKVRASYSALFMSQRDLEDGLTFNSVGIRNDGNEKFLTEKNKGLVVLVEAVFVADPVPPGLDHPISGQLVSLRSLSPMHATVPPER